MYRRWVTLKRMTHALRAISGCTQGAVRTMGARGTALAVTARGAQRRGRVMMEATVAALADVWTVDMTKKNK